jgi:protein-tyrosine phosphatase
MQMGSSSVAKLRYRTTAFAWIFSLVCLVVPASARSQAARGLPNFGQVTKTLYRGAQPTPDGFAALQRTGVTIVVNFRDDEEARREKREVESFGMKYVAIPWSGRRDPSTAQIVQFLDLVRDNPQATIFVHCKRGADRTGTMVAAYRVAVEHSSTADAVAEMLRFHYDYLWLPQLQRYVASLPRLLQSDTRFSAYAASAPPFTATVTVIPTPVTQ